MNVRYPQRSAHERGAISIAIVVLTTLLATTAIFMVRIGLVGEEINNERLLVAFHGKLVGRMALEQGLDETCDAGGLIGHSLNASQRVEQELQEGGANRRFNCQVEERLIERTTGPESEQGTFRVFRLRSASNVDMQNSLSSGANNRNDPRSRRHQENEIVVEIREEQGNVERRRAKIVFVLDYSGSMRGNRISQLKRAVQHFVGENYPMDFGVVLFNNSLLEDSGIGSGGGHNQQVMRVVNGRDAGGGTQFTAPLRRAADMLRAQPGQDLFIVLLSDGQPHDGGEARSFVNNVIRAVPRAACEGGNVPQKCITIYTLGVDNADLGMLRSLSGNAANPGAARYNYDASANQVSRAFDHIISNILCRYGPLRPGPTREEEETLNVFLSERPLRRREYSYDRSTREIEFYENACNQVLDGGGNIVIRYGEPRIYMEQP